MRPISDAFIRSIPGSHTSLYRARVCSSFQTGVNPVGIFVDIMDGSVTLDGKAAVRSNLDITVNGTRLWPTLQSAMYAPYGNEFFIEAGIQYSDSVVEYVGLGYFRIQGPEQEIPSDDPLRIAGVDRMQAIIDARLLSPRQFAAGTTFGAMVNNLILEIYPSATIQWDDASDQSTLTRSVVVEEDRYGFLDDAITSRGKIWYWDYRGVLVIKNLPSTTTVSYAIARGAGGNLVSMKRSLSRVGAFNAVVAAGEAPDTNTPRRGVVIDGDPGSPTYFYGRFGQVPRFYSSPFLGTDAQCVSAAQTILNQNLGLPYTVDFGSIVNPALEPFDVVTIDYSAQEARQTHILDTVTVPLREDAAMKATTRQQHVILARPQ